MKCERCQPLIEDYFDGELEQQIASQVSAHVEGCNACSTIAAEIKLEREIYSRYHREVDVTADLWANVQARIQEQRQNEAPALAGRVREWFARGFSGARISPVFAAALVLFAIGITVGVMSYLQSHRSDSTQVANKDQPKEISPDRGTIKEPDAAGPKGSGGSDTVAPSGTATIAVASKPAVVKKKTPAEVDPNLLVRQAEQKYLAAITILSRDLGARRRQLDPETRARFDFALAEIDHTIVATQQAVRGNPSDPIALGYLLTAYSKKVEFLRDTARDETEANRP